MRLVSLAVVIFLLCAIFIPHIVRCNSIVLTSQLVRIHAYSGISDQELDDDDFVFEAYNEEYEPVSDVLIMVYFENGTLYESGRTDANGEIKFFDVPVGNYNWEAYYNGSKIGSGSLISNKFKVVVYTYSGIFDGELDDDDYVFSVKIDGLYPLPNAIIRIYFTNGTLYYENKTDDVNGMVLVFDLPSGTYNWEAEYNGSIIDRGSIGSKGLGAHVMKILNPLDGSTISGTVVVEANVSSYFFLSKIEIYIDNKLTYSDTNLTYSDYYLIYRWDWNTITYSNGIHTLKLAAYDNSGNVAYDEISVNVQNVRKPLPPTCFIATATYGSELAPEVQFLRVFRDQKVMKTFAGNAFMQAFNAWYYSFSPTVAGFISDNSLAKATMRAVLYPLIGILRVAYQAYSILSFNPELAVIISGLIASCLIGLVYLTPFMLLIAWIIRRRNAMPKLKKLGLVLAIAWIACLILIALGEFISSSKILMLSTSMLVILTFFSSPLTATNIIYKVIKPETKFRK